MPVNWRPKTSRLEDAIAEEQAKIAIEKQWQPMPATIQPQVLPQESISDFQAPISYPIERLPVSSDYTPPQLPERGINIPEMGNQETRQVKADYQRLPQSPIIPPKVEKEKPISVPFWQRALHVFAAPFEWVDETIIKPGLAITGTTLGFVPDVLRKPGEDFFEWQKRAWEGWEAPGIDVNVPWRKEPWRVDMKGVLAIAPWLLIPGAGQVGTATRAGVGIAGMLGKIGKAGRVLGTAVEYSPWGLVEKTAGVAIKGGFRAVGAVSEKVSTKVGEKLFGKYVPPPVPPEVAKLTRYMKEVVVPAREAFEKKLPQELRAKQEAVVRAAQKEYLAGNITLEEMRLAESTALKEVGALRPQFALTKQALAARKAEEIAVIENRIANGELTEAGGKALITKIEKSPAFEVTPFERTEVEALNRSILEIAESGLLGKDSSDALFRLLMGVADNLPEPRFFNEWSEVFGIEFAKAVRQFRTPQQLNNFMDTLQIGKSLVASADLSATFRQGLFFNLLHPTLVPKWFGRQIKALLSEKLTFDMDDALRARPAFRKWRQRGAYFAPQREITARTAEEAFPSRIAERIPGVKRSQRAFNTYLNEARLDTLELAEAAMTAQGATEAELKLYAQFVNMLSGRGALPKSLEKYAPALNTILFSPKLQAATLQLPRQLGRMLASENPYMRKEAARALITFVGGGASLLGLLHLTGVSKVELDPRSGDFAKIKIGETRLDIWRGYVQYARFAAQLLTGERKSAYGNMNKAERGEIAGRFLQTKLSPAIGLLADIWRGETFEGKPIFSDTTGFSKVVKERILPLAIQDVIDAMEQGGINQAWVAAPATLGIGALTYVNDFVRVKGKIAKELGFESWDDIDPKRQREIENRNAELQAATIAFDRQVMGTAWGDWRLAGKAVENIFRQNVENAVNKYRQDGLGVDFRNKISDAWTERRGAYKTREAEPRFDDIVKRMGNQNTLESLVGLGPEGVAIKIYQDALYGDDMSDEFGDYRFDEANVRKELLRQQLGDEMFDYVEEYQGVRYQDFPQEFQDLQEAKKLMKSYWGIADLVVKRFGQTYADSPAGKALISKHKKQMRLQNPELNRAYERFYAQK